MVTRNRYLEGDFGPVREEQTLTDLAVTGTIPDYLVGRYVRNGPNPVVDHDPETYNWLVGSGMVHGVRLRDGRAEWYRNRWVRSGPVAAALGEELVPGTDTSGLESVNIHVIDVAGRTFAISDMARPYELSDELDTIGISDFGGTLPDFYAGHPKRDPETGEWHAVSYSFEWDRHVRYTVLGTDGRIRRMVDVEVAGKPMMHDFALSENHVVLFDHALVFDPTRMQPLGHNEPLSFLPYRHDPDYPVRVGVMAREGDGSDIRWFDVDPCYVQHSLNAYDDGDRVVVDLVQFPKMFDQDIQGPESIPSLSRWTIDLAADKVVQEPLDELPHEFPRIDERRAGLPHRYGYTVGFWIDDDGGPAPLALFKHDFAADERMVRRFEGGRASEFLFLPAGPDAAEDEGVLMGYVSYRDSGTSDLAILDAETLETVAAVHIPARIPHGFHGSWLPN